MLNYIDEQIKKVELEIQNLKRQKELTKEQIQQRCQFMDMQLNVLLLEKRLEERKELIKEDEISKNHKLARNMTTDELYNLIRVVVREELREFGRIFSIHSHL